MKKAPQQLIDSIAAKADALKEKILNTPSDYPEGRRTYYFSNSGDDRNNGLSVYAPLKTLRRLKALPLTAGDVVLFRRGDLWRDQIQLVSGVTYSAYGDGEKPRFYGSINASCPEDWIETQYPHVWVYKNLISYVRDIGCIIINGGKLWGIKVLRNNIEGTCYESGETFNGRTTSTRLKAPFTDERDLCHDLEFYHGRDEFLYLYCPDGNPGKVFDSIELSVRKTIAFGEADGVTVDNLCFRYVGIHAIGTGGHLKGLTVRNCEFGWIGGSSQFAELCHEGKPTPFGEDPVRLGNAIEVYGSAEDYSVYHNYIYEVYDAAITAQYMNRYAEGDCYERRLSWHDNLIDRCHYCFELWLAVQNKTDDQVVEMKDVEIFDNLCLNNGYGWSHQRKDKAYTFFYGDPQLTVSTFERVEFHDNIFFRGRRSVSSARMFHKDTGMHFRHNTIIHNGPSCGFMAENPDTFEGNTEYIPYTDANVQRLIDEKYWEDCDVYCFDEAPAK